MDEQHFDKRLKEILETPPEFELDPSAIKDMQRRLQMSNRKRRRAWAWWLVAALLLFPLFGGMGYLFAQYQKLQEEVDFLSEQSKVRRDTVLEKQIIYRFDTVYQTVYRYEPGLLKPIPAFSLNHKQNRASDEYVFRLFKDRLISGFLETRVEEKPLLLSVPGDPENFDPPSLKPLYRTTFISGSTEQEKRIPATSRTKLAYYFVPTGFRAGVQGSGVLPAFDFGKNGVSAGIELAVQLPRNRSLLVRSQLLHTEFEVKDAAELDRFPDLMPNDPSDVFHELKGQTTFLEVLVGLRQRFFMEASVQPFITAGILAYRPLKQQLTYEYLNTTGEYKLSTDLTSGAFSIDNLHLGAGVEVPLGSRFVLASEVIYRHGFSVQEDEFFPLRYWALQLGMYYQFSKK